MAKHIFLVLTNPVEGKEAEYNDWYDNRHLDDVMRVAGFDTARRYTLAELQPPQTNEQRYAAIYEIDTDDPAAVMGRMVRAAASDMPLSDALDLTNLRMLVWKEIPRG